MERCHLLCKIYKTSYSSRDNRYCISIRALPGFLAVKLSLGHLFDTLNNARETHRLSHRPAREVFDFHPFESFDLAPCFFSSVVLFSRTVWHSQTIAHGCCDLKTCPIVASYEPVHTIYTKTTEIWAGRCLEMQAKI